MKKIIQDILEPIILGLIVFDVVLLAIITFFSLPVKIEDSIILFDLIVCIVLMIEFSYHFLRAENKWQYFKHHWFELVAAIPIDFFLFRSFRLIKFLRFIKFLKIAALLETDLHLLKEYMEHTNLGRLLTIISLTVIITSVILFIVDPNIKTMLDGFWYVIVTVTSVGYGDITPTTTVGKIIGLFLVIIGFVLLSIFIGAISSIYQNKFNKDDELLEEIKKQNEEILELKQEILEIKNLIDNKKDL